MSLPTNSADKCTRCDHVWHGVGCGNVVCGCPTAWVEPVVEAPPAAVRRGRGRRGWLPGRRAEEVA